MLKLMAWDTAAKGIKQKTKTKKERNEERFKFC